MRSIPDGMVVLRSNPPLANITTLKVTIATDGSLTTPPERGREITGAAVHWSGKWLAWHHVLPGKSGDAGSLLAELMSPLLALQELDTKHRVTLRTDSNGVVRYLRELLGPRAISPRHLLGDSYRLPSAPKPRHLVIDNQTRNHPLVGAAHELAAIMHDAHRLDAAELRARLDGSVRITLGNQGPASS